MVYMTEKAKGLGRRILIVIGIVILAFILIKLLFGAFSFLAWLVIVAVVAISIIWLASKL